MTLPDILLVICMVAIDIVGGIGLAHAVIAIADKVD